MVAATTLPTVWWTLTLPLRLPPAATSPVGPASGGTADIDQTSEIGIRPARARPDCPEPTGRDQIVTGRWPRDNSSANGATRSREGDVTAPHRPHWADATHSSRSSSPSRSCSLRPAPRRRRTPEKAHLVQGASRRRRDLVHPVVDLPPHPRPGGPRDRARRRPAEARLVEEARAPRCTASRSSSVRTLIAATERQPGLRPQRPHRVTSAGSTGLGTAAAAERAAVRRHRPARASPAPRRTTRRPARCSSSPRRAAATTRSGPSTPPPVNKRWHESLDVLPHRNRKAEQERSAVLVAHGRVIVSFGGLAGDCDNYVGYVTSTADHRPGPDLPLRRPDRAARPGCGHHPARCSAATATCTSRAATARS